MGNHTKGPWRLVEMPQDGLELCASRPKGSANFGRPIATIIPRADGSFGEEELATARLLLHTPALLDASEKAYHALSEMMGSIHWETRLVREAFQSLDQVFNQLQQ